MTRLLLVVRYWFAMLCLYGIVRLLEDHCSMRCAEAMETIFTEIDNEMRRLGIRVKVQS